MADNLLDALRECRQWHERLTAQLAGAQEEIVLLRLTLGERNQEIGALWRAAMSALEGDQNDLRELSAARFR